MSETNGPVVLDRSSHPISRRNIDPDALKVLYRLARHGYKAYLVGGAVRDLLLGKTPKDYDVATDARPGQIKKLFSNCFLVGRRFRLAHIRFRGGKIIEVATFRREADPLSDRPEDPHNTFGTPQEDAHRRDITINALFYDISTFSVIDYVGGLEDMKNRRISVIGDPHTRYREDPVRMWRVLRHAARHGFAIDDRAGGAIRDLRGLLATCSGARLYEELNKDLAIGDSARIFDLLMQHGLMSIILGGIGNLYESDEEVRRELVGVMETYDIAVRAGKTAVSASVAYSLVMWPWARRAMKMPVQPGTDRAKHLADLLDTSGMTITMPRSVRAAVVHIVLLVDLMMRMLERGTLRTSIVKRHDYPFAVQVFSLLTQGSLPEGGDPFLDALACRCSDASAGARGPGKGRRRRPRRSRRRGRAPRAHAGDPRGV